MFAEAIASIPTARIAPVGRPELFLIEPVCGFAGLSWRLAIARAALRRSGRARLSRRRISDDGLPAIVDVDVLDPNVLLAPMPEPSKNLDLRRTARRRARRRERWPTARSSPTAGTP